MSDIGNTYQRPWVEPAPLLWTYRDLIDRLIIFGEAGTQSQMWQNYRLAVDEAYRWVVYRRPWRYLLKHYEVAMTGPYSTGTIAYTESSRQVVLTGGTWPTWAANGHLRVAGQFYDVYSRDSNTQLTLAPNTTPGIDLAALTGYELYQSVYTLPGDYRKLFLPENTQSLWQSSYVEPNNWFTLERHIGAVGIPNRWTVMRDPKLMGSWAIYVYPHPAVQMTEGFLYQSTPRPLRVSGYGANDYAGTVSISASASVIGSGTHFTAADVGSVLRVGTSTTAAPDGYTGVNPYSEQGIITAVSSTTACTLGAAFTGTYTTVKYVKSDPVDVPESMIEAILSRARWTFLKNKPSDPRVSREYERMANDALIAACENDVHALVDRGGRWVVDRMQMDVPLNRS